MSGDIEEDLVRPLARVLSNQPGTVGMIGVEDGLRRAVRALIDTPLEALCPGCSGNGNHEWPSNPDLCDGQPCPTCNGMCHCAAGDFPTLRSLFEAALHG